MSENLVCTVIYLGFLLLFILIFRKPIKRLFNSIADFISALVKSGFYFKGYGIETKTNPIEEVEFLKAGSATKNTEGGIGIINIYGDITAAKEETIKKNLANVQEKERIKILVNRNAHFEVVREFYKINTFISKRKESLRLLEYLRENISSYAQLKEFYDSIMVTNPIIKQLNPISSKHLDAWLEIFIYHKLIEYNYDRYSLSDYGNKYLIFRIEEKIH